MRAYGKPISLILAVLFLFGCSTPRPVSSGRQGYFDRQGGARVSSRALPFPREATEGVAPASVRLEPGAFQWPLRLVEITSPFGKRGREFHEGVDLRAPSGTPVYASQAGVVLYAGSRIRGYGKLVVLRHRQKVATIYAHNSKLLVIRGQKVKRGQQIAISGATGHVSGPHLHFEIRKGLSALNPLTLLPKSSSRSTLTASKN